MGSTRIGVISDTHGLLRPEAVAVLEGSRLIIHAGDIGKPDILQSLRRIAPLIAVRGNIDTEEWATSLPLTEAVETEQGWMYVIHDLRALDLDPDASSFKVVISGHSHRPSLRRDSGVIYLNPGSAGPQRFRLPITMAVIHERSNSLEPELVRLKE